jgi:hypothetical protein
MTATHRPKSAPIVKRCGCGRTYTLIEWQGLRFQGVIRPTERTLAELRLCTCGSSIAVRVRSTRCTVLLHQGVARRRLSRHRGAFGGRSE